MIIATETGIIPCEVTQATIIHVCEILDFSGHDVFLALKLGIPEPGGGWACLEYQHLGDKV